MPHEEIPPLRRVAFHDHARAAADELAPGDPNPGLLAHEATRLAPFQRIQVASDQLHYHAESVRRGQLFDHPGGFDAYSKAVLADMETHARALAIAAAAARSHVDEVSSQVKGLVKAVADQKKKDQDEHPQLTTSGAPHPLEEGGYDANKDPGLPVEESDVAAGKAGHTTKAQAEAIAKADLAHNDEKDAGAEHGHPQAEEPEPPKHPHAHPKAAAPKDKDKDKK